MKSTKARIAQRQATNARLAAQDAKHRCASCKRALPATQAYVIAADPLNRRFCSDACVDRDEFLEPRV
jgi:hypothetical protein